MPIKTHASVPEKKRAPRRPKIAYVWMHLDDREQNRVQGGIAEDQTVTLKRMVITSTSRGLLIREASQIVIPRGANYGEVTANRADAYGWIESGFTLPPPP